jgi:hypothetical protein
MKWPANGITTRLAAKHADNIRKAFNKAFDSDAIAKSWSETHLGSTNGDTQMARDWAKVHIAVDKKALANVFPQLYADGYVTGETAAGYVLAHTSMNKKAVDVGVVDWNTWKPGSEAAAALVKPKGGLRKLLDNQGLTIDGISNTKIDRIGTILGKALETGIAPSQVAPLIDQVIDDPEQALVIATTETARAVSVASRDLYTQSGVQMVEWLAFESCEICSDNADASPISIDDVFPSGDTEPPGHPNCTCSLAPADVSSDLSASADLVKFVPSKMEMERALSRLKIIPNAPSEDDKYIEMPWQRIEPITVNPNIWDNAELSIVNLEDLTATDTFLNRKKLKEHIKFMGQALTPYRAYALVIQRGDQQIIIDGHHRLMAQWLLGQETAPVWLAKEN